MILICIGDVFCVCIIKPRRGRDKKALFSQLLSVLTALCLPKYKSCRMGFCTQIANTINCAKNIYLKEAEQNSERGILQMGKPGDTTNSNVSPLDSLGGNHTFLFFQATFSSSHVFPFFSSCQKSSLCIFPTLS